MRCIVTSKLILLDPRVPPRNLKVFK